MSDNKKERRSGIGDRRLNMKLVQPAAPVSAPTNEVSAAELCPANIEDVGSDHSNCPDCSGTGFIAKESGEQVKRYAPVLDWDIVDGAKKFKPLMVEVANAPKLYVLETDHLSALSKLQGRVDKLEKELAASNQIREAEKKILIAEIETNATFKASLPERAKAAAEEIDSKAEFIGEMVPSKSIAKYEAIILAEMERKI